MSALPHPTTPFETRFWAKVREDESGCWLWQGRTNHDGYGQSNLAGRPIHVHRWAYEHLVGPVPAGLELDHLCRVRKCLNPAHLEPVTHQENMRRGFSANGAKTVCRNGHPYDEANTRMLGGRRYCRICFAAKRRRYRTKTAVGGA